MKQELLLSRLLDKYEKSKHLMQPGSSSRRVMLRVEKRNSRNINMSMRKFGMNGMRLSKPWRHRV